MYSNTYYGLSLSIFIFYEYYVYYSKLLCMIKIHM